MYGYEWMGVMPVFGLLCMAALVTLGVWMVRGWGHRRPGSSIALATLEERYAKGEIQREGFERIRRDIAG